jgi:tau tubulin kinase
MLEALEELHSLGWLHRDVKPSNFCLGRGVAHQLFVLDFGLARGFLERDGRHKAQRRNCGFRGTLRYASVQMHRGLDAGRRDDLASLLYILAEQLLGRLPWRRLTDKPTVLDHKAEFAQSSAVWGPRTSPPLLALFQHLHGLAFPDQPDYAALKTAFRDQIHGLRLPPDAPFDWEPLRRAPNPLLPQPAIL